MIYGLLRTRGAKVLHLIFAYNPLAFAGSVHPKNGALVDTPTDRGRHLRRAGRRISIILHTLFRNLGFRGGLDQAEKTYYARQIEDLSVLEPNKSGQTSGLEPLLSDHAKSSFKIFDMELPWDTVSRRILFASFSGVSIFLNST